MRKLPILLILCSYAISASCQELEMLWQKNVPAGLMMTDNMGQLYLSNGLELVLYSKDGKERYTYSDLSHGAVTCLDTRNPLKLLLFYPDHGQIMFLDNTLSPARNVPIDLSLIGMELSQLACTSFDNGLWLYDPTDFRLVRLDQSLNITNEVNNINLLVGADIDPVQMSEADNWLYLNDPLQGIFVFDSFGTYSKLIPITGVRHFQVRDNGIFMQTDSSLIKYDPLTLDQRSIDMPVKDFTAIRIEKGLLFVQTPDRLLVYRNIRKPDR